MVPLLIVSMVLGYSGSSTMVSLGNTAPLLPGMVFSDEPGIYMAGKFGVRIEDTLVVTDDAPELLTLTSKELLVL